MNNPIKYSTDVPISSLEEDTFGRAKIASAVSTTIKNYPRNEHSFVIGLFAAWGDGKTSVLNLIKRNLENDPNVIILEFNPWIVENSEQLFRSFFSTICKGIEMPKKQAKETLAILAKCASGLPYVNKAGDVIAKALETTQYDLKEMLETHLTTLNKKVVIIIDDIDRLDKDEIYHMMKLVKLTANLTNTIYLLAFDDKMVASAIDTRYGGSGSGQTYLEKIIQLPINLPQISPSRLLHTLYKAIDDALALYRVQDGWSEKDSRDLRYNFGETVDKFMTTPRQVRRFTNSFIFSLGLVHGEVHIGDLLTLEAIKVLFPPLYTYIQNHQKSFITSSSDSYASGKHKDKKVEVKKICLELLGENISDSEREDVWDHLILPLFPTTCLSRNYSSSCFESWIQQKRITTSEYFQKYFTMSTPDDQVNDVEFETFVQSLEINTNTSTTLTMFENLLDQQSIQDLVLKIELISSKLSEKAALRLCDLIIEHYVQFKNQDVMLMPTDFGRTGIAFSKLLKRISEPQQQTYICRVMEKCESLELLVEVFRWIHYDETRNSESKCCILSKEDTKIVGALFSKRIEEFAKTTSLLKLDRVICGGLISTWKDFGNLKRLRQYLTNKLQEDPNNITLLLIVYARWWRIGADTFSFITNLVDVDIMLTALTTLYGDLSQLDHQNYDESSPHHAAIDIWKLSQIPPNEK